MLRFVVLSCALSLVLGLLSCGFLVTILQVGVDVLGNAVNLVLDLGKTLDPVFYNVLLEIVNFIIELRNDTGNL